MWGGAAEVERHAQWHSPSSSVSPSAPFSLARCLPPISLFLSSSMVVQQRVRWCSSSGGGACTGGARPWRACASMTSTRAGGSASVAGSSLDGGPRDGNAAEQHEPAMAGGCRWRAWHRAEVRWGRHGASRTARRSTGVGGREDVRLDSERQPGLASPNAVSLMVRAGLRHNCLTRALA